MAMKTRVLLTNFALQILFSAAILAQPLNLNLTVDVANAPVESEQKDLIPTQFEIYQLQPSTTFTDKDKLYSLYKLVHGPKSLYQPKPTEEVPSPSKNPRIENFDTLIQDFPLATLSSRLLLRGTGFDVFASSNIFQRRLLIDDLCQIDEEKNSAICKISFPSFQLFSDSPANLTHIRISVFKQSTLEAGDLKSLYHSMPADLLPKKDEYIKNNSRQTIANESDGSLSGYFLYAHYHFEASLKEMDEGLRNEKTFEWRYGLNQAQGRLSLLAGDYLIEREQKFSDGNILREWTRLTLKWGEFVPAQSIVWKKTEDL